jgi:hypothetical protein
VDKAYGKKPYTQSLAPSIVIQVITGLGEDVLKWMMAAVAGNGDDRDIAILDLPNNIYR